MGRLICDRCIRGIRSKGETIMVGSIADNTDDIANECHWCGGTKIDLYEFTVPLPQESKPGNKKERVSLYKKTAALSTPRVTNGPSKTGTRHTNRNLEITYN